MIEFGKYKYIGNHNEGEDNSKYDFNDEYYKSLLRDNRYKEAANYLSKYQFTDSEEQERHLHYIDELRRNGDIIEATYAKVEDPRELSTIEFADKVGTPGWYNALRYKQDAAGADVYENDDDFRAKNPEAAAVQSILSSIGSSDSQEATRLSINFSPKKYGWLGLDFLRKDTDDLGEFYSNLGFGKEMLESYGVDIHSENDGSTTITFDKTNEKAIAILSALPNRSQSSNLPTIAGYYLDNKDNKYHKIKQNNFISYHPYGETDNSFGDLAYDSKSYNFALAKDIKGIIQNAQDKRNAIFEKRDLKDYEVSSNVFDLKTDRTEILEAMHEAGQLTDAEFNRRMKNAKSLVGWLRSQTYLNGTYSNVKNDKYTDEHFENIGQEEWFTIKSALSEFDDKDVIIQGQTINGEIGLRFTLPQAQRKKRLAKTSEGGFLHTDERNIQLFIPASQIPGMLGELQSQIDNDTQLQAIQDFNDIVGYGVKKQLYNGEIIQVDNFGNIFREYNGELVHDDRPDAREKAIQDLNQTRILDKGKYLKFQHINKAGDVNYATYEEDAKRYAILAGNDLMSGELVDFDGNPIVTRNQDGTLNYGDLFGKGIDETNYQRDVYRKILKIREIYDTLMNDIRTYNMINR